MNLNGYASLLQSISNGSNSSSNNSGSSNNTSNNTSSNTGSNSRAVSNFTISNKVITIPVLLENVAMQGDYASNTIHFTLDRYYDGFDLSGKRIAIKYRKSNNETGEVDAINIVESVDTIDFDWLLDGTVTSNDGVLVIQVVVDKYNNSGDVVFRYQTETAIVSITKSINPNNNSNSLDYYYDVKFFTDYASTLHSINLGATSKAEIYGRSIIMTDIQDIAVHKDSRCRSISFTMGRYVDAIDLATMTPCVKFILPDGETGDRSFVYNFTAINDVITFDWLLDARVTSQVGNVTFAIEFIGYDSNNDFYCWNTIPTTFTVVQGLNSASNNIVQPTASWFQSWNILADKYLSEFRTYLQNGNVSTTDAIKYATQAHDYMTYARTYAMTSERLYSLVAENEALCKQHVADSQLYADQSKSHADDSKTYSEQASQVLGECKDIRTDIQNTFNDFRRNSVAIEMSDLSPELQALMAHVQYLIANP